MKHLLLVTLLVAAFRADGQSPGVPSYQTISSDWATVRQFAPGARLSIAVRGAKVTPIAPMYFKAADDAELTVTGEAGQVERIRRDDVLEIAIVGDPDPRTSRTWRKRGALIGLAAGIGLAALSLHSYCKTNDCDTAPGVVYPLYAMFGAVVGTVAGASIGHSIPTLDVVYRAPQATDRPGDP